MQYGLYLNLVKAHEWELSHAQMILFGWLYSLPSWAEGKKIDGQVYFYLSKTKIVQELPSLTSKPDTAYRFILQLIDKGLIEKSSTKTRMYIRLTEKAKGWNHTTEEVRTDILPSPEEARTAIPTGLGQPSYLGWDSHPTNHYISNQNTSITKEGSQKDAAPQQELTPPPEKKQKLVARAKPRFDPTEIIPDGVNAEAWCRWCDWRKSEKKKAITPQSATMQLNKLKLLTPEQQAMTIDHSIENQYQGLFPEKFTNVSSFQTQREKQQELSDKRWDYEYMTTF